MVHPLLNIQICITPITNTTNDMADSVFILQINAESYIPASGFKPFPLNNCTTKGTRDISILCFYFLKKNFVSLFATPNSNPNQVLFPQFHGLAIMVAISDLNLRAQLLPSFRTKL